jgi:hypothetical protein
VSDNTVRDVRSDLESGAQIAHLSTTTGKDGKQYPAKRKPTVYTSSAKERAKATQPAVAEKLSAGKADSVLTAERQLKEDTREERRESKRRNRKPPDAAYGTPGSRRDGYDLPDLKPAAGNQRTQN